MAIGNSSSHTVTFSKYGHTLTSTLYGDVTDALITAAKNELAHRAEQLYAPAAPEPQKFYTTRRPKHDGLYMEAEWDFDDELIEDDDDSLGG